MAGGHADAGPLPTAALGQSLPSTPMLSVQEKK